MHDRYAMRRRAVASHGPAIVEERESTLVVPPGARCTVSTDGSLVVEFDR